MIGSVIADKSGTPGILCIVDIPGILGNPGIWGVLGRLDNCPCTDVLPNLDKESDDKRPDTLPTVDLVLLKMCKLK